MSIKKFKKRGNFFCYSQGQINDCYFLSALTVLAQKSSNIELLFLVKKINKTGIYCVRFCKNGIWKQILIDDRFPFQQGILYGAQPSKNQLWVPLLEKAWAKLHGGYEKIQWGHVDEALQDMTGAPIEELRLSA